MGLDVKIMAKHENAHWKKLDIFPAAVITNYGLYDYNLCPQQKQETAIFRVYGAIFSSGHKSSRVPRFPGDYHDFPSDDQRFSVKDNRTQWIAASLETMKMSANFKNSTRHRHFYTDRRRRRFILAACLFPSGRFGVLRTFLFFSSTAVKLLPTTAVY